MRRVRRRPILCGCARVKRAVATLRKAAATSARTVTLRARGSPRLAREGRGMRATRHSIRVHGRASDAPPPVTQSQTPPSLKMGSHSDLTMKASCCMTGLTLVSSSSRDRKTDSTVERARTCSNSTERALLLYNTTRRRFGLQRVPLHPSSGSPLTPLLTATSFTSGPAPVPFTAAAPPPPWPQSPPSAGMPR